MKKVRLSSHSWERWNSRVGEKRTKNQLVILVQKRLMPLIQNGIRPFVYNGELAYFLSIGFHGKKLVFAVVAPDSQGLWSGWRVITFLTDDEIDSISEYIEKIYGKEG